ncbi:MAG: hypothetical protein CM15mP21_6530 [Hyphomicrobiales bacterium]|nr:MAG: hypothetical protein CM15mP21_6530 [Hyphomicrobiales bacterium]
MLSDRREFKAELVLDDARTDLAVLKLQNPPSGFQLSHSATVMIFASAIWFWLLAIRLASAKP